LGVIEPKCEPRRGAELAGVAKSQLSASQEDTDEPEAAIDSKKDRWIIDLY